jgi:phosphodiesterase/alkaline phosphatase D-like protein
VDLLAARAKRAFFEHQPIRYACSDPQSRPNRPPSEGLQFFGTLDVDHRTLAPTARLHDVAGRVLYSVELPAEPPTGRGSRRG